MPILDTSFLIRLQAGDEAARALLEAIKDETLVVPPWVVVEFATGHTSKPERVLEDLTRAFTLLQTTPQWAIDAAKLRRVLRAKGAKIRLPDFWIATFAHGLRTYVVTQDTKHFAALGVPTRSW